MDKVTIDRDIQMPKPNHGRKAVYPWTVMEIGDSFLPRIQSTATPTMAGKANKIHAPKRFASRKMPNGEIRIWRVA